EMQHQQEGRRVLDSVLEKLVDVGKVERPPTMDGKKMTALIMPNKAAAKAKPKPVAAETLAATPAEPHGETPKTRGGWGAPPAPPPRLAPPSSRPIPPRRPIAAGPPAQAAGGFALIALPPRLLAAAARPLRPPARLARRACRKPAPRCRELEIAAA